MVSIVCERRRHWFGQGLDELKWGLLFLCSWRSCRMCRRSKLAVSSVTSNLFPYRLPAPLLDLTLLALNYSKLPLWEFVEYNKMIYMDADIQVFDNIDHLFDLPSGHFYGVVDCLCDMHGRPCAQKLPWPHELGPQPKFYLNGGMFVFDPNLATYRQLFATLKVTPPTPFAEQDFLNMFFREKAKAIPPTYNLLVATLWRHPEAVDMDEVKVVHYCVAGSKPWKYNEKEEYMDRADIKILVNKWWDIYNDPTLDFTHTSTSTSHPKLSKAKLMAMTRSASSAA